MRHHQLAAAGDAAMARIESARTLDHAGYALGNAVALPVRTAGPSGQRVRNALHGTWLGHPLHPLLVTVPVGAWAVALVLDAMDAAGTRFGARHRPTADLNVAAGCIGAVTAATAGLADWNRTHGKDRRVGLVHAALNSVALAAYGGSLALRRRGQRGAAQLAALLGWGLVSAGGYVGAHLVYRRRVGVDQADRSMEPRAFTPVLALDQLAEDRLRRVEVWDPHARAQVGVVLVRHRSRLHALGARCSHMGGPLDEGWLLEGGLVCPWHGSRYDLATGAAIDGPSTCPQPRYEVRVREGVIELRRPAEPGDATILHLPAAREELPDPGGRRADEVLVEHHQLLRRLFERVAQSPRHGPERRSLLRLLAHELEMHEQIEDEIFYPAVQPVTEEVPLAHAEHQHLADLLAVTLRLDPASARFEEHLQALRHAVEHHAGAEERTMFPEAQRLGGPRLRQLGRELEARLDELRDSRLARARRAAKIRVLEGV